jgi:hypothetical protein
MVLACSFTVLNALKFIAMSELGNAVHSSVKTLWFGIFSSALVLVFFIFYEPSIFAFWLIGSDSYPLGGNSFLGCLIIGFFSWASQESLSLALTTVKTGTTAVFFNVGLIIAFSTDVLYFDRSQFWTDYLGIAAIIICTSIQGWLSNEEKER